jgi:cyanophycin synthetase
MNTASMYMSIELLKIALADVGYALQDIVLGDRNYTRFTAPNGNVWLTSNTQISYPFTSSTATAVSTQKNLAYDLAKLVGVTIPWTILIKKSDKLSDNMLDQYLKHAPLIVKPNDSSLSRGLTLNITTKTELKLALELAFTFKDNALVQQQVSGQEIRFAVLDGKVGAALLRQTPHVTGDGQHSVAELIDTENIMRSKINLRFITYPLLDTSLINANIDMKSIPKDGEVIELSKSTMIREGASVYNILETVHESYVQTVEYLAKQLGNGMLVVDMLIQDHTTPQCDTNYAFIEFNKAPVLKLFYGCRDGKNFDILKYLVPMIDKAVRG